MTDIVRGAEDYLALDDDSFWSELGKAVRDDRLGSLPEEDDGDADDATIGRSFFEAQLDNIRAIFCSKQVADLVADEKKRDVVAFVAAVIDLMAAYFGKVCGTMILVQIFKIGVDRFCHDDTSR